MIAGIGLFWMLIPMPHAFHRSKNRHPVFHAACYIYIYSPQLLFSVKGHPKGDAQLRLCFPSSSTQPGDCPKKDPFAKPLRM